MAVTQIGIADEALERAARISRRSDRARAWGAVEDAERWPTTG